ncbi:MAG TPA: PqqD family protein [Novosphingobium sp.]|nr:PqqD family protein [Novosphingobium sp.]
MSGRLAKDAARFVETRIDDEAVVMNLDSGDFFSLQGTARAVWELLDGTRDRDGVVADLAERYGAPREAIAADVDAFLAELGESGLLVSD